ncbi:hypothetical protein LAG90_00380 [Marinilongibacter aquaticus]|uniref:hypothetical protein n=1 Tax=Marinilongibacter aquaticus TaxID=2975157 RepID=UPI0021BD56D1|nr:hypothetical protein [Marinilongibacter aquaticus]UBM59114.1 hypothetical protein LAG90_00380 [Marinilongibacter aquaticus]
MDQKQHFIRFVKNVLIFGSPLLLLVLSYFVFDPFHVLRKYEAYPDNYLKSYNRNRISTQVFLNNNEKYRYKSFVFGSSRSSVFYTKDWGKYIHDSLAYHFDASNEDILGIAEKVQFIHAQGNKIEHALIVLDAESFNPAVDHNESIIHIRDWRWHAFNSFGQFCNRIQYHLAFFKAFFKDQYFIKYFDTLISKKYKAYMYGSFENKHMLYTPVHNDFIFQGYINRIKEDSLAYYHADIFYERTPEAQISADFIDEDEEEEMEKILAIFKEDQTDYRIIISPGYDQKKLNPEDLHKIERIFGASKVYDFSGKNALTEPLANYYEIYHFKPSVARQIMEKVYNSEN